MIRLWSRIWILFLVTKALVSPSHAEAAGDDQITKGDLICGPRCIQFILKDLGRKEPDLVEVVREVQWPDLGNGADLEKISQALNKRGVYTLAIRLPRSGILRWPYPVIVCLNPDLKLGVGHFVVAPRDDGTEWIRLWVWPNGYLDFSRDEFNQQRSEIILLSATHPIRPEEAYLAISTDWTKLVLWTLFDSLCIVEVILLIYFVCLFYSWRKDNRNLECAKQASKNNFG